jgi:hypothetical protein
MTLVIVMTWQKGILVKIALGLVKAKVENYYKILVI